MTPSTFKDSGILTIQMVLLQYDTIKHGREVAKRFPTLLRRRSKLGKVWAVLSHNADINVTCQGHGRIIMGSR
jgi:hypothetical protein